MHAWCSKLTFNPRLQQQRKLESLRIPPTITAAKERKEALRRKREEEAAAKAAAEKARTGGWSA